MNALRKLAAAASLALATAAVTEQLRKPIQKRTWEGTVLRVPYDFRPVTMNRVHERMWNPGNPSLFAPNVYGVGWTINLYRLLHP